MENNTQANKMESGNNNCDALRKCIDRQNKRKCQFEAEVNWLEQLAMKKQHQLEEQVHNCDKQKKYMENNSNKEKKRMEIQHKRQHQADAERIHLDQLAKKKDNQSQRQYKKQNATQIEVHNLQRMMKQHGNNRLAEYQRLQDCTQVQLPSSDNSGFKLTNHQLSIQAAVRFLNADDPQEQKWKDFEKSPVKSLLLWYANAGCFAFDEYKGPTQQPMGGGVSALNGVDLVFDFASSIVLLLHLVNSWL